MIIKINILYLQSKTILINKTMKKSLILLCSLFALSCVKTGQSEPLSSNQVTLARNMAQSEFNVPYKDGLLTKVTIGDETVGVYNEATTLMLPSQANPQISYIDGTDVQAGYELNTTRYWHSVAFEDSKDGDYDYNDLVFHVRYKQSGKKLSLGIHPIALGSVKTISLGLKVYQDGKQISDEILCNDARFILFENGTKNFINTASMNDYNHYGSFTLKKYYDLPTTKSCTLIWYIKVGKDTFYAVNDKYNCLDINNRPYGIIITNTGKTYNQSYYDNKGGIDKVGANWFAYPMEGKNISHCYSSFEGWLNGGKLDLTNGVDVFDIDENRIYEMTKSESDKL